MYKILIVLFSVIGLLPSIDAQNLNEDINSMLEKYKNKQELRVVLKNNIYENSRNIKASQIKMFRNGERHRFENNEIILLRDNEFVVTIIKAQKLVKVNKSGLQASKMIEKQYLEAITSQKDLFKTATFLGRDKGIKKYSINLPQTVTPFIRMEIEFDENKKVIQRLAYFSGDIEGKKYCNEIIYETLDFSPTFSMTDFLYSDFVKKEGILNGFQQFTLTDRYKKYTLINQSHIEG